MCIAFWGHGSNMQRTEGVRDTGVERKDRDLKRKCARDRERRTCEMNAKEMLY